MNKRNVYAITVAVLVVATGFVGVVSPAVGTASEQQIDSCTTITEPGVYELGSDISDTSSSPDACIVVQSDDVVVDGNGHSMTLTEDGDGYETPYAVQATGVDNLTVSDLTTVDWGAAHALAGRSVDVANASDVTVTGLTVDSGWAGVVAKNSTGVTVSDANLTGTGVSQNAAGSASGIRFENVRNAEVSDSDLQSWESGVRVSRSSNVTVAGSTLGGTGDWAGRDLGAQMGRAIYVDSSTDVTVRDNDVTVAFNGVILRGRTTGTVVAGNTLSVNKYGVNVGTVGEQGDANVVRNNTMRRDEEGVYVVSTASQLDVVDNDISNNTDGVHVEASRTCGPGPEGGELVDVHGNTIAGNGVGLRNQGRNVVNATRNYWGADDGPASVDDADAPFQDPVTGELADGAGDRVTESTDANESGVSNVHFDPWLQMAPSESTTQNESTA
ncbi:MAG: nitrous oxide reductase family maturation protein NosD [Haloferacaceae archaeon]